MESPRFLEETCPAKRQNDGFAGKSNPRPQDFQAPIRWIGVGSRFRETINPMESGLPENDSRPLPRNFRAGATIIRLPVLAADILSGR
jgi:hypothetical protein